MDSKMDFLITPIKIGLSVAYQPERFELLAKYGVYFLIGCAVLGAMMVIIFIIFGL